MLSPFKRNKRIPYPAGWHHVGTADVMCDGSRNGVFVRLFYPIETCENILDHTLQFPMWCPRIEYHHGYTATSAYNKLIDQMPKPGDLKVPVLWQAPLLREEGRQYPVIIFSHGLGACRTTYSYVCMDLASHGFVVAAVEHRDQSASATYFFNKHNVSQEDDGDEEAVILSEEEWLPFYKLQKSDDELEIRTDQLLIRAMEIKKVLDLLKDINIGRPILNVADPSYNLKPFTGVLDLHAGCGLMGHGFGATAIIKAMAEERRFRVGVCLDGWMEILPDEDYEKVKQPLLFINTEAFDSRENIFKQLKFDNGTDERKMITLRGTVHQSQTDFALMIRGFMGKLIKANGSQDPDSAMDINDRSAMAFLWKYLGYRGNDSFWQYMSGYHRQVILGTNVKLN